MSPYNRPRRTHGGSRGIALLILDLGARRGGWSAPRPGRFIVGKYPVPIYRRLGEPQDRSGRVRKISLPPGFDRRTVQPVASRYTDWATRPEHARYTVEYFLVDNARVIYTKV
jgi:hypothetical protein